MRKQPYFYHDPKASVLPKIRCDDIVDDTDFKKTLQEERDFSLTTKNTIVTGQFDYPDGVVTEKNRPTDYEMAIRSGTLDKADISTAERILKAEAEAEGKQNQEKSKREKQEKLREARQAHLDKQVGFDSQSVSQQ